MLKRSRQVPKLERRPRAGHKGTFGTVLILAGSEGMLGAAILAARGALRGGAGLVQVGLPRALQAPFTIAVPAATTILRTQRVALRVAVAEAAAIVVGPGLGTSAATKTLVEFLLAQATVPMVLDADALNVLAPMRDAFATHATCVLTPHPGEAARLLGTTAADVQADREAAALALADRSGQIAVLKGAGTIVTDGEGVFVNSTGNPGLGTGGSGDVLAGLLGALLAQGQAPFDAACLAVHAHGAAGDLVAERLSELGLCAEDLPLAIAEVLGGYEA